MHGQENWVTKLLLRLGFLKFKESEGESIPSYFDVKKIQTLISNQILFWDKINRKVRIGYDKTSTHLFKRDSFGRLDYNRIYFEEKTYLDTKYTDEVQLCVAVGMV